MSRPLRIEFPGAIYHVTSRGDRREPIFDDEQDRELLLCVLAQALDRFDAQALAYCLMGNHYHFVLHTRAANLSRLMRHVNGVYTQAYNRRHGKVGHLLQGRFKAVLVDRDEYLLEVCRYVELNPVRAALVGEPGDWVWSSYRAHVGQAPTPAWLDTNGLHGYLLGREVQRPADSRRAALRYVQLVAAARDLRLWESSLRQQIYLGSEAFVERMQQQMLASRAVNTEVPKAQRGPARASPEAALRALRKGRVEDAELARCYRECGLTMAQIAAAIGVSVPTVSRRISRAGV